MKYQLNIYISAAFCMLSSFPALAVYKCIDNSGRTNFQERPCSKETSTESRIEVKPASGSGSSRAPSASAENTKHQQVTETERISNLADRLIKENRLSTINDLELNAAKGRINSAVSQCNQKLDALKHKKIYAKNNLAGATWEQSISSEMQSIATMCTSDQQRHQITLDKLLAEKSQLEKDLQQ